jgi:hypothetical protein
VAAQTALPGAQATAQAGATLVSIAVAQAQPLVAALQGMVAGVTFQIKTTPDGAAAADVTDVQIEGTDAQGALTRIDTGTRQSAATAALVAAAQYYPKANIALKIVDAAGNSLVTGNLAPGQAPKVQ